MSKTVLIIDDEEAAAQAIAEACQGLGLSTSIVTNPAQAKPMFEKQPAELVIVDLFLPGTDGYKVGQQIRSTEKGATVPIIAVSGVLKQATVASEVHEKLQGEFLPKPFDVERLKSLVAEKLGLAPKIENKPPERRARPRRRPMAQAKPFESDLRRDPVYRIYARLYEQRASGYLELTRGKARRRVVFHQGRLRFATSNLKQENVGGMQVARGEMENETFQKAVSMARDKRMSINDALVATKGMTPAQMNKALSEQVRAVARGALGWADGRAKFEVDPEGAANAPDHVVHPLEMVVHGIADHYPPAGIKSFLEDKREAFVHRTELLEREMFILRKSTSGEQVTIAITGHGKLGDLLDRAREQDLPLLFALVGTSLVKLDKSPQGSDSVREEASAAPEPPAAPAPPSAPAAPKAPVAPPPAMGAPSTPGPTSEKDKAALAEIEAEHARLEEASHYEVLGVSPNADDTAIQAAYRTAASRWHVDRFAGVALGDTKKKLDEIFSRIGQAREVLSDKDERQEYDVYLDRKAKGLPTDVETILRAEGLFQDGEKLMKEGKAARALEKFDAAISLNDTEPEFFAWRGYARYRLNGESAKKAAIEDIERCAKADPNNPAPNYLRGMIELGEENLEEATRLFKRALVQNPEHTESQQQLRRVKAIQEKKGGLFGKLFKK